MLHRILIVCVFGLLLSLIPFSGHAAAFGVSELGAPSTPGVGNEVRITKADRDRAIVLAAEEEMVVTLPVNPSTGYRWEAADVGGSGLELVDVTFQPDPTLPPERAGLIGVPALQVMRFVSSQTAQPSSSSGPEALVFVYRRPWETTAQSADSLSYQVIVAEPHSGLRLARRPTTKTEVIPDEIIPDESRMAGTLVASSSFPASYDLCASGGCTSVRDQGGCGACWAFATVGVLESAIKVQDGVERDLSEQYLISCNTDGWSCGGGWWAHDYHMWQYPPAEAGPGARLGSKLPLCLEQCELSVAV